MITSGEFCDREAEKALADHYGEYRLGRVVVDGQKGYRVTHPNGVKCFHFRLRSALMEMIEGLGHGDDRDVMVFGEPEQGNAWEVRR